MLRFHNLQMVGAALFQSVSEEATSHNIKHVN